MKIDAHFKGICCDEFIVKKEIFIFNPGPYQGTLNPSSTQSSTISKERGKRISASSTRRKSWQPTSAFWRIAQSLAGRGPKGGKESNMTEAAEHTHTASLAAPNLSLCMTQDFLWWVQILSLASKNCVIYLGLGRSKYILKQQGNFGKFCDRVSRVPTPSGKEI